jgi:hypothetical protein
MINIFYHNKINNGQQSDYNIVNMNKNFILFVADELKKQSNINTTNATTNVPITNDEIKNQRLNNFDKNLNLKQNEFNNAFNKQIPDTPNFKSPIDIPIEEIDILTKQKMEEREKDIQFIYNNFDKKNMITNNVMKSITINEEIPKKSIIKEESIDLHPNISNISKKNISWSDNHTFYTNPNPNPNPNPQISQTSDNFFIKLKKIHIDNDNNNDNNNNNNNNNNNDDDGLEEQSIQISRNKTSKNVVNDMNDSNSESIKRLAYKIDKIAIELNKCHDTIILLFNTLMSLSKPIKQTTSIETNTEN